MVEQGIDESAVQIAGGGVDDQTGRLVHDDEIVILMHDGERDILCYRVERNGRGQGDGEGLSVGYSGRCADACRSASGADMAFADQSLQPFARKVGKQVGERTVQAHTVLLRRDRHVYDGSPRTHLIGDVGMRVAIARTLLKEIVAIAGADGNEVCGLLLGSEGVIEASRVAANVAPDPSRHFELDPAVLLATYREARRGGMRVIGHYHSHPSGVAEPSATDAACAAPDGSLWLIVAAGRARLWISGADGAEGVRFAEVALDIR